MVHFSNIAPKATPHSSYAICIDVETVASCLKQSDRFGQVGFDRLTSVIWAGN